MEPPAEPFRVELTHEDETWTWGPTEAGQRVHGPALDFVLLATRRRHRQGGSLVAEGPDADAWLDIAQAFAGRPGPGRPRCPRQCEKWPHRGEGSLIAAPMHTWHAVQSARPRKVYEESRPTPDNHHKRSFFFL
ncbi:hypothetical protein [Kocuria aegyptia]|uniref:hypothetical protein n=1 Tax=Kocuria aegyptia TaxID=330943 RepID=UPI003CD090F9